MKESLPLNPIVLKWARERQGYDVADTARKLNKNETVIKAWENGESSPTYIQLETLAYNIYKCPIAVFFFPEPPTEKTPKSEFRSFPDKEIEDFTPRLRSIIRKGIALQYNLEELFEGTPPTDKNIVRDISLSPYSSKDEAIDLVRNYLGVTLDQQISWNSADIALKNWRLAFENCGISIFKDSFNQRLGKKSEESQYSGFCLHDPLYPLIYINNSKAKNRQIFTLFHELAHLILGTGGIDTSLEDYIKQLDDSSKSIEIFCNAFAGSFLVPDSTFDEMIINKGLNDSLYSNLARHFCVSREVILRKLLDRNLVSQSEYKNKTRLWKGEIKSKSKESRGNYYYTQGSYMSDRYKSIAFQKYYQKKISAGKLADYLGIKVKNLEGVENRFLASVTTK